VERYKTIYSILEKYLKKDGLKEEFERKIICYMFDDGEHNLSLDIRLTKKFINLSTIYIKFLEKNINEDERNEEKFEEECIVMQKIGFFLYL
jgi:heterodisulfide reductase subunit C